MMMMTTGCSLWIRHTDRASNNGFYIRLTSESDCMAACLESLNCVGVDFGLHGCILHNDVADLTAAYNASGITQLVLNRHCLPASQRSSITTAGVPAQNFTETTGNNDHFISTQSQK